MKEGNLLLEGDAHFVKDLLHDLVFGLLGLLAVLIS